MTAPTDPLAGEPSRDAGDKRWITVLSPTLTSNAVFRTHTIVQLLRARFRVQLIGFDSSNHLYEPLAADETIAGATRYHAKGLAAWTWRVRKLETVVRGDAIIAVKPMLGSFGAALILGRRLRRPVILDIDDWEPGFLSSSPYWEFRSWGPRWFFSTESPLFIRLLDGFVYRAAAVTVSNSFLQARYGGHWIPHVRDTSAFRASSIALPAHRKTVLFAGSPRGHKGLPTLLKAWKRLGRADSELRLAIPNLTDPILQSERVLDIKNVVLTGPHRFAEIPGILADSSVVVVPQDNVSGAVGQLPMKLIDAMAAAKPIVATDVGDAARWLTDGAGIVVTPGSVNALADGLAAALDHPEAWKAMGDKARARLLKFASERVLARRLCDVVSGAIEGRPLPVLPAFDHESEYC
jgi:glycosyltransferase involved in cell wall biosynthesis